MEDLISHEPADSADFELGQMLGSRRAFSSVAGKCSAAEAESMRRMRDEKLFTKRAQTWDEFCPKYLGMSRSNANRVIGYLEAFGPDYFELAQLTKITPAEYRGIAANVKDKAVHWQGEAIALLPENSAKLGAAVDALRQAAEPPPIKQPSRKDRIAALKRTCSKVTTEFAELSRERVPNREKPSLWALRAELLNQLGELDLS